MGMREPWICGTPLIKQGRRPIGVSVVPEVQTALRCHRCGCGNRLLILSSIHTAGSTLSAKDAPLLGYCQGVPHMQRVYAQRREFRHGTPCRGCKDSFGTRIMRARRVSCHCEQAVHLGTMSPLWSLPKLSTKDGERVKDGKYRGFDEASSQGSLLGSFVAMTPIDSKTQSSSVGRIVRNW